MSEMPNLLRSTMGEIHLILSNKARLMQHLSILNEFYSHVNQSVSTVLGIAGLEAARENENCRASIYSVKI